MLHNKTVVAFLLLFDVQGFSWLELRADRVAIDFVLTATIADLFLDFLELAHEKPLHCGARQIMLALVLLPSVLVDNELQLLLRRGKALLGSGRHEAAGL